jgi:hypothetical protein
MLNVRDIQHIRLFSLFNRYYLYNVGINRKKTSVVIVFVNLVQDFCS